MSEKAKALGIEVVAVRIRRADLPSGTSQSIYDRMMSERQREAKELRAQGFEWAQKIQAAADRERTTMLADAQELSTITRGEGEAEANKVVAEAYDRDPDFFRLYRSLQAYRRSLAQTSSTVLLSPGSEFLHLFNSRPNAVDCRSEGAASRRWRRRAAQVPAPLLAGAGVRPVDERTPKGALMRLWIKDPLAILATGAERGLVVEGTRIVELVAARRRAAGAGRRVVRRLASCRAARPRQHASSFLSDADPRPSRGDQPGACSSG